MNKELDSSLNPPEDDKSVRRPAEDVDVNKVDRQPGETRETVNGKTRFAVGSRRRDSIRARRTRRTAHNTPVADSNLRDLVLITGLSGAGKSEALACFEDAGYFCVDNLPPTMIAGLTDLFAHKGSSVSHAAVVSDARGGSYFEEMAKVLNDLEQHGLNFRLMFLDAEDQELVNRFKETRRRHPLSVGGSGIADGIAAERDLLAPIKLLADDLIDTTEMSAAELRRRIIDDFLTPDTRGKLTVEFTTYGFKHGPPRNVDLAFDVRFLPNPHYESALRDLTGLDAPVREYVEHSEGIDDFLARLIPLLDYLLPAYASEGKSHLTIGIGCTGGRHRSVVVAEKLAELYRKDDRYAVDVMHRDIGRPSRQ